MKDEKLCACFIDWQKAFDHVNWTKLTQILKGNCGGKWSCSWLRHCTRSWKVMGLICDGFCGIFCLLNPSGCDMALGWTVNIHTMKVCRGNRGIVPCVLTSTLGGGEWSTSCPDCFTLRKEPQ